MSDRLIVRGAREHNLKNVHVEMPRNSLVVITGVSGSGKSSLAFDTIYAEGQRRYVESLSAYARQFLAQMQKPDVDSIDGLSPAIAIEQKSGSRNPRSTVGTVTEVYDYLRLLFARIGKPHCHQCGRPIATQTVQQIVDQVMSLPDGTRVHILAPIVRGRKGEFRRELATLLKAGFVRVRVDGEARDLTEGVSLAKNVAHEIDVLVDRLVLRPGIESRLADSLEVAFQHGNDVVNVESVAPGSEEGTEVVYSQKFACSSCGLSYPELTPRMFSFNNPYGACSSCSGLGVKNYFDPGRIVPDERLSLAQGAIAPWRRKGAAGHDRQDALAALARHYRFELETPFSRLSRQARQIILYGSGNDQISFVHERRGRSYEFARRFDGVIAMLERRHKETESDWVREDLAQFMSVRPCPACEGARLKPEALAVRVGGKTIANVVGLSVEQALGFFATLDLSSQDAAIADRVLREVRERLGFLRSVGLDYVTLDRAAGTLSGGEAQRIRLATQIGAGLSGVLYVLDEPSIGLHQRDNARLIDTLRNLQELGNTVIVVEHDRDTILAADYVIDMGPGAGADGGYAVAVGPPAAILAEAASLTGQYLSGAREIAVPAKRRCGIGWTLSVKGARHNNLRDVTADFLLGGINCVTGVSGSGKSSLVVDTLHRALAERLSGARDRPGEHDEIVGWQLLDKVIEIDQSPIGRTPRSNPATYTGLFTHIRELFAELPESRVRGYGPGRFSFNVKGGRCEACSGDGVIRIEMHFLPDVYVPCEICHGSRYNRETLEVRYRGKSITQVLDLPVGQAADLLANVPPIRQKLDTLMSVGLDYVHLGQSATTLSGGEAQRIKLARELGRRATGKTLYILDEPTTGLHFHDIDRLLAVLHRLADAGNTIIIIEHNLDVAKTADRIIDLGPEGGSGGGRIIAAGTPEEVAAVPGSFTGRYLRTLLPGLRD